MPRPYKFRYINFNPRVKYFKPHGVPLFSLKEVQLRSDEVEAIRLKNIEQLDQIEAAKKMKISQSTFQRILKSAYDKIADALINGKAIKFISK